MFKTLQLFILLLFVGTFSNAQDFEFGEVSKEEVLEKSHSLEPETDAAVLFKRQETYFQFNPRVGASLVTEVHERIKIYTEDGFNWATQEITLREGDTDQEEVTDVDGYTYNIENGKLEKTKLRKKGIFEIEVNKYRSKTKFTMPAVTEGSVIEYRYKIVSPFFTSIDDIQLQYTIPINHLEVIVRIPEYLVFRKHINPKSPLYFDIKLEKKNFFRFINNSKLQFVENEYQIVENNIPSLIEEPYVDYLQNYAAILKWELKYTKFPNSQIENYSETWEGVTKTIYEFNDYKRRMSRSGFFEEEIDKLLAGVTNPTKKAKLVFNFVKEKVKWNDYLGFGPEKGTKDAFQEGSGNVGDINLLLTAMLRYAGLDANPILVSTKENGIPLFPTRTGFNYLISSITTADKMILLDATEAHTQFGGLPWRARNWQGRLVLGPEKSSWINLMPKEKSMERINLNLKINEDYSLAGKSIHTFNKLHATSFRDDYSDLSEEDYIKFLENNNDNIVVSELKIENKETIGKNIKQTFNFELENGVEVIGGRVYLKPLLFTSIEENPFKAEERKYPIFFNFPSVKTRTVNIMIPEGYKVASLPTSSVLKLNGGAGTYKFILNKNGKFLRLRSVLDITKIAYTPQDYEALKKFYAHMVEKESEPIVLVKI